MLQCTGALLVGQPEPDLPPRNRRRLPEALICTLSATDFEEAIRSAISIGGDGGFRFYFFSREESRLHVHVQCTNGEAKFWLEPVVHLAQNHGLNARQLRTTRHLIKEHADDIRRAWARHFPG